MQLPPVLHCLPSTSKCLRKGSPATQETATCSISSYLVYGMLNAYNTWFLASKHDSRAWAVELGRGYGRNKSIVHVLPWSIGLQAPYTVLLLALAGRRVYDSDSLCLEPSLMCVVRQRFHTLEERAALQAHHPLSVLTRVVLGSTWTICIVRDWITSRKGTQARVSTFTEYISSTNGRPNCQCVEHSTSQFRTRKGIGTG